MKNIILNFDKFQCFSFDIYDTLLKRYVVQPSAVFSAVERRYEKKYGVRDINNFANTRIMYERIVRNVVHGEITLDQIYEEMKKKYPAEILENYKELEIQAETELTYRNEKVCELYRSCVESGKSVILVSDMYLSESIIKMILEKNNIVGYYKLFLSSKINKTKSSGELFQYIIEYLHIEPQKVLHIGDNFKSDIINAFANGIRSQYVMKKRERDIPATKYALQSFLNIKNEGNNCVKSIGYQCFGPMLYGFASWLDLRFKKKKYNKILFLSRDGMLMQKAYELINPNCVTDYFYASRRAFQVAAIWLNPEFGSITQSMFFKREELVTEILTKWGLQPEQYINEIKRAGLEPDTVISKKELLSSQRLRKLFSYLQEAIIENSYNEYSALCTYLKQIGLSGTVAIVDIGWYGNMQRALERIIESIKLDIQIDGYYLGIVPSSNNQLVKIQNMEGYLFSKEKNEDLYLREQNFGSLFELFFMAYHGSLEKYRFADKTRVEPVFMEFEYNGTNTAEIMQEFQNSALEFVHDFVVVGRYFDNDERIYAENLIKTFCNPSYKVAEIFGNLKMFDNGLRPIGGNWRNCNILGIRQFYHELLNASWKNGFLKNFFRIPLPYSWMLIELRKIKSKKVD